MPTVVPDPLALLGRQVGVLLGDRGHAPLDRLVDDVDEPHRLAAAALQPLAVGRRARGRTTTCSARAGGTSHPAIADTANTIAKCCACPAPTTYSRRVGADPLDPVEHARQVARGVREGAGPAAHDQRQRLALAVGEPGREHDLGAVGLLEQPGRVEPLDDLRHQRLVAALAGQVVVGQQHAELAVHVVPVRRRSGRRAGATARIVSASRCCSSTTRARARSWNSSSARTCVVGRLVERVEVAEAERLGPLGADVDEVLDEHAERPAPVADVVLPDDVVADGVEHAGEGVADHRRAEVPDVHLLGDVRRRVVDDDALGLGSRLRRRGDRRRRRRRRARR